MVNLTDIWKASGKKHTQQPKLWLQKDHAQDFIKYVSEIKKVTQNYLFETRRGRNGGTYAHWQVALAY